MVIALKNRSACILKALINEYIRTGEPVASEVLNSKYNIGVSPATIRNDFVILTEKGFLYKPYISSGRIPTDKGWRFFIESIFEEEYESLEVWENKIRNQLPRIRLDIHKLLSILSEKSRSFCFCYLIKENEVFKLGFKYIFADIEEEQLLTFEFLRQIAESLETLDEKLKTINRTNENLQILIGRKNPFIKSDQFSSLINIISQPKKAVVGILGPKRMPYKRNIAILKAVSALIS